MPETWPVIMVDNQEINGSLKNTDLALHICVRIQGSECRATVKLNRLQEKLSYEKSALHVACH